MEQNVDPGEYVPRIMVAVGAGVAAALVPNAAVRGLLLGLGGMMLTTVAVGYCPATALMKGSASDEPEWRTLKTWRVEA